MTVQKLSSSSDQRRKIIEFQFSEGGNLIFVVQSTLRDGFQHGHFPLYLWRSSVLHNTITHQVGSCFQEFCLHLLSLHKLPNHTAIFCNWADKNVKEMAHQEW